VKLSSLDQLARRQHGVVARHQTELTDSTWRRAVNAGSLIQLHPGVARVVGSADTPEQRIVAAVLAAGPGALASHRSAAHLHGVPAMGSPPVHIIIPRRSTNERQPRRAKNSAPLTGVSIHRPRDLKRLTKHRIAGIPCTNVLRTLLDLGAVAPDHVHGAVGHVLTHDLASLEAIETTLNEHAGPGRTGVTALRAAIDDWAIDGKPADSVLEPAMRALISRFRLPPVEFHPFVGGREVDFRIVGTPIVLECDGWRYHGRNREQFERDRAMDAEFVAHGWIVIRFTYRAITGQPSKVARLIAAAVERWSDLPAPDVA
jgi:very-short-patch-repair endonuclease